jgi:predicted HicB family RNase H-like nuclease
MTDFDASTYRVTVQKVVEDGEVYFRALVAELPDVAVYAENAGEAYDQAVKVVSDLRALAVEQRRPFPPPLSTSKASFSGRVTLRLPRSVHADVDALAVEDECSLNTWITATLAAAVAHRRAAATPRTAVTKERVSTLTPSSEVKIREVFDWSDQESATPVRLYQ